MDGGGFVVGSVVGILVPMLLSYVKRIGDHFGLSEKQLAMAVLVVLLFVSGGVAVFNGDINLFACAGLDLEGCFVVVLDYIKLVGVWAFFAYKYFYQPLGVDAKLSGR